MPPIKPPRPEGLPRAARDEVTATEPHTRPPPPPARDKHDSLEVSADTLLTELAKKNQEAEHERKEKEELRLKLAAAESGAKAAGPRISLGSAQWWVLVIGALAAAFAAVGPPLREWVRPSASAAQIESLQTDFRSFRAERDKSDEKRTADADANAARWRIVQAFMCAQGVRARKLDCDNLTVTFEEPPAKGKGPPVFKTQSTWPPVPEPRE